MHFSNDFVFADVGHDGVGSNSGQRSNAHCGANRIRGALDSEARERAEMLVEGAIVPESLFAATDAAMARLDGIAGALVPLHHRARIVGNRALAAHLVEAIALARVLVVKGFDEEAGVVVGATIAGVVDAAAIELLWPAQAVECRNLSQHQ